MGHKIMGQTSAQLSAIFQRHHFVLSTNPIGTQ